MAGLDREPPLHEGEFRNTDPTVASMQDVTDAAPSFGTTRP